MAEITEAYFSICQSRKFIAELRRIRKEFQGRPTPVTHLERLSDALGGKVQLYAKREDLNHSGAHKLNHCMGEALLAKYMGKKKIIAETGELIRERNITITFNRDEMPYNVFADPEMMKMVLSNFMSNAVKYCDHVIMIQLIRNGRKIEFSITNDGAKIDKKDLDKIWDIFYTTDKARTDRMSSSGVGLSVVKSILDAHKADYSCTSGDNGTEFKFSMPAHETA